jgi:hypothetical protein
LAEVLWGQAQTLLGAHHLKDLEGKDREDQPLSSVQMVIAQKDQNYNKFDQGV